MNRIFESLKARKKMKKNKNKTEYSLTIYNDITYTQREYWKKKGKITEEILEK